MEAAKLLEIRTHQFPGKLNISEYFFEVPKDHSNPGSGSLRLFARGVERFEKPTGYVKEQAKEQPWLCYLQGGPGMPCGPPQAYSFTNLLVEKGYKVLFLDQRGTGLSSTVTDRTLAQQGGPVEQAQYLQHFRADSIVKDCEAVRKTLTADYPEEKKKWSILGQSFGGFCCVSYLSSFPESLQEVFTTGGLPPLVDSPDTVYEKTFEKLKERNVAFYAKYPEDVHRVKGLVRYLSNEKVRLPSGGHFSVLRFRQLGIYFGFHGDMDLVHDTVFRCSSDLDQFGFLTRPTLIAFDNLLPFDSQPLYALIHELCYLQGAASKWSADRVVAKLPDFNNTNCDNDEPIYFFGEMCFKAMYDDYAELQELKETADILAGMDHWTNLYDEEQLAKNKVPMYSITYVDDMYVDFDFARKTASKIRNCKQFITNAVYHNGLTRRSDEVVKQLFSLRDDVLD